MTIHAKSTTAAHHTYAASEEEHREHPDVRARRLEGCYDTARRLGNPHNGAWAYPPQKQRKPGLVRTYIGMIVALAGLVAAALWVV